jgi:hypothetical protein
MQIGSVGTVPGHAPSAQIRQSERTERGPDRDNDGDEGKRITQAAAQLSSTAGRGGSINILV